MISECIIFSILFIVREVFRHKTFGVIHLELRLLGGREEREPTQRLLDPVADALALVAH